MRARYFEAQGAGAAAAPRRAGVKLESSDPLARRAYGKSRRTARRPTQTVSDDDAGPEGTVPLRAPMQGTIVSLSVAEGATVLAGQEVLVLEAMKMQHTVTSAVAGHRPRLHGRAQATPCSKAIRWPSSRSAPNSAAAPSRRRRSISISSAPT